MTTHPNATGNTGDKQAAAKKYQVRATATGRLLASNDTREGAEKTAEAFKPGSVRVEVRGAR